jgi:23S rRNA pseudouridine955/2504/2580 synthase
MSVPTAVIAVASDDDGGRLDRWLKRRFPGLTQGQIQKWLRTGQLRVDGHRAKAGQRLAAGQIVRIPPSIEEVAENTASQPATSNPSRISARDRDDLLSRILWHDDHVLAIDKPAGLAVQGGTGTTHHLDAMLDFLRFDLKERPRLVHRLDRDTAGVLLLARTARAATSLTEAFRTRTVRKLYWAAVVGLPKELHGLIRLKLTKKMGRGGEKMVPDRKEGMRAETLYRVVERAGRCVAWVAMEPLTGRTHQLRVHAIAMGTPILGDGKYGGQAAFVEGHGVGRGLHLLARTIRFPGPSGRMIEVTAPLPPHMGQTWNTLGFDEAMVSLDADPFYGLDL